MRRSTHNEGESQREKKIRKEIQGDISRRKRFSWLRCLAIILSLSLFKTTFFSPLTVFSFLDILSALHVNASVFPREYILSFWRNAPAFLPRLGRSPRHALFGETALGQFISLFQSMLRSPKSRSRRSYLVIWIDNILWHTQLFFQAFWTICWHQKRIKNGIPQTTPLLPTHDRFGREPV